MKLFALFAASAMAVREIPVGSATHCWSCNAQNLDNCAANGQIQACQLVEIHPRKIGIRGNQKCLWKCENFVEIGEMVLKTDNNC